MLKLKINGWISMNLYEHLRGVRNISIIAIGSYVAGFFLYKIATIQPFWWAN
jgi:hypothetical protein